MSGAWCSRCGDYDVWGRGCRCSMVGRVWLPESGETEADARDVWSKEERAEWAVKGWAARRHARDYEAFSENPEVVCFRPAGEDGEVQYFSVYYQLVASFIVNTADDDEVAEARKQQARTIRSQRSYARKRRAQIAAILAVPRPLRPSAYRNATS